MQRNNNGRPIRTRYGFGANKAPARREQVSIPTPRPDTKQFPTPRTPYLEDMPCVDEVPLEDRPTTILRKRLPPRPVPQRQVVKSVAPATGLETPSIHRARAAKRQQQKQHPVEVERANTPPPPSYKPETQVARERFLERQHMGKQQINDWNRLPLVEEVEQIIAKIEEGGVPYLRQAYLTQNPFVLSIHTPGHDSVVISAGDSKDEQYEEEFGLRRFIEVQATVDGGRRMLVMGDNGYPIELQSEQGDGIDILPVVSRNESGFKVEATNKQALTDFASKVIQQLRTTYKESILKCENLGGATVRSICTTLDTDTANRILVRRPPRPSTGTVKRLMNKKQR